jgi:hypothetical protein
MTSLTRRCLFLLCILLSNGARGSEPLTLDQLIARNVEARGGHAAIKAVQSIRFNLHIVDPDFEVDGVYHAARPGYMRIDIIGGGKHVYTEALDEKRGWQWKGNGDPIQESETATNALRHGVELPDKIFGLDELRRRGNQLELVGRETVERISYYVVRLTFADGFGTNMYLDPNSWLITRRRDVRALHPDIDPTPTTIETVSTDFRKVGQLVFAFASTDTDMKTGKVLEKSITREITLNPPIQLQFFHTLGSPD